MNTPIAAASPATITSSDSSMVDEYYMFQGNLVTGSIVQIPLWSMNTLKTNISSAPSAGSDSSMVDEYFNGEVLSEEDYTCSDSSMVDEYDDNIAYIYRVPQFRFLYGR